MNSKAAALIAKDAQRQRKTQEREVVKTRGRECFLPEHGGRADPQGCLLFTAPFHRSPQPIPARARRGVDVSWGLEAVSSASNRSDSRYCGLRPTSKPKDREEEEIIEDCTTLLLYSTCTDAQWSCNRSQQHQDDRSYSKRYHQLS